MEDGPVVPCLQGRVRLQTLPFLTGHTAALACLFAGRQWAAAAAAGQRRRWVRRRLWWGAVQ